MQSGFINEILLEIAFFIFCWLFLPISWKHFCRNVPSFGVLRHVCTKILPPLILNKDIIKPVQICVHFHLHHVCPTSLPIYLLNITPVSSRINFCLFQSAIAREIGTSNRCQTNWIFMAMTRRAKLTATIIFFPHYELQSQFSHTSL